MKRTQLYIITLSLILFSLPLFGGEITSATSWGVDGAYYLAHNEGYQADGFALPDYSPEPLPGSFSPVGPDGGRELGTSWGGAELQGWIKRRITIPLLQGEGAFTEGNNLAISLKGALSPVTLGGTVSAVLTPVAFLNFEAGAHIGTGWAALGFNGLGMNQDGSGNPVEGFFEGFVTRVWGGGTFQFDLAALMPGDWNHLVVVAGGKVEYQNYSRAEAGESWMYMGDAGENFNGLRYLGTYLLGYLMPLRVDTVGFLVETKENWGDLRDESPMDEGGWGSDFREITLGPLCNIQISENSSMTLLLQFRNHRSYTDETIFYNWFQNRNSDSSSYWRLERLALSWSCKL